MAKLPYIALYPGDWERDTNLLTPLAEFALLKLTIKMFDAKIKGVFKADFATLSILFKSDLDTTKAILKELIKKEILDVEAVEDDGFCIKSRRMIRESEISNKRSEVGKKGVEAKRKQNVSKTKANVKAKLKQNADNDIDNEDDIEDKKNVVELNFALEFFKSTKTCRQLSEKYKIPDLVPKFTEFYNLKADLEFENKDEKEIVLYFSNWLPNNLIVNAAYDAKQKQINGSFPSGPRKPIDHKNLPV